MEYLYTLALTGWTLLAIYCIWHTAEQARGVRRQNRTTERLQAYVRRTRKGTR